MTLVIVATVVVVVVLLVVGVWVARRRKTVSVADAGRAALREMAEQQRKSGRSSIRGQGGGGDEKLASDMYLGSDASGMP